MKRGWGLPTPDLVWEGESLPAAADLTILSYDEFSQAQLRGAPLIIDQVGRRVPREVATVVDVRRDGRIIRVQERRGRDWKTLFKNVSADDAKHWSRSPCLMMMIIGLRTVRPIAEQSL